MPLSDPFGLPLTGASTTGVDHYLRAVHELQCFIGDPVGSIDAAIAADPGFVMAHVFKGSSLACRPNARRRPSPRTATRRRAAFRTPRERTHVAALGALAGGGWNEAGASWKT